jgi:hypothetical protein
MGLPGLRNCRPSQRPCSLAQLLASSMTGAGALGMSLLVCVCVCVCVLVRACARVLACSNAYAYGRNTTISKSKTRRNLLSGNTPSQLRCVLFTAPPDSGWGPPACQPAPADCHTGRFRCRGFWLCYFGRPALSNDMHRGSRIGVVHCALLTLCSALCGTALRWVR